MATLKQINANRLNSLKSTGPSEKGKYWSSKNSIKHGLTAKNLIVGEDQAEFENYRNQMLDALKPSGIFEEQVVFKIIDVGFRLRRVFSIESGLFNQEILSHEIDEYKTKVAASFEVDTADKVYAFIRDEIYFKVIDEYLANNPDLSYQGVGQNENTEGSSELTDESLTPTVEVGPIMFNEDATRDERAGMTLDDGTPVMTPTAQQYNAP